MSDKEIAMATRRRQPERIESRPSLEEQPNPWEGKRLATACSATLRCGIRE